LFYIVYMRQSTFISRVYVLVLHSLDTSSFVDVRCQAPPRVPFGLVPSHTTFVYFYFKSLCFPWLVASLDTRYAFQNLVPSKSYLGKPLVVEISAPRSSKCKIILNYGTCISLRGPYQT